MHSRLYREVLMLKVDALRGAVSQAVQLLADASLAPALKEEDIELGEDAAAAVAAVQPGSLPSGSFWAADVTPSLTLSPLLFSLLLSLPPSLPLSAPLCCCSAADHLISAL
jgi:NhaP-type Na+/H+ or K+/H+ antiporter